MQGVRTLNRSALVVRPREPYLRWAASLDATARGHAKVLASRVAIYLVPEDPAGEEESAPIEEYFEEIFSRELETWTTDEGQWPLQRDFATFRDWFEVTAESMVVDLGTERVRVEEI